MTSRLAPLVVLFGLIACNAETDPTVQGGVAPIVNGTSSIADPAVVALMTQGQHFCSGTLVRDRYVVTAAHCLPPNLPVDVTDIDVFFGRNVFDEGTVIGVADALAHPNWSIDDLGYDVGVIELESAVEDVTPIPMFEDAVTGEHRGAEIRLVGFGITSEGGGDNGIKRHGTGSLEEFDAFSLQIAADPAGTCNGDSGGTALIDVDGTEHLIGIHSRSDCISFALDERVDAHLHDFILPFIDGVEPCGADGVCNEDCDDDPDCGPVCEDDGVCEAECTDDPDCGPVCEADGVCEAECADDPDCGAVCIADEMCVEECADGEDPDCEPAAEESGGGCAVGTGTSTDSKGGALLLTALGVAVALRRRRRRCH